MNALLTRRRILENRLIRIENVLQNQAEAPLDLAAAKVHLGLLETFGTDCQALEEETLIRYHNNNEFDAHQRDFGNLMERFTNAKVTLLTLLQQQDLLRQQAMLQQQMQNDNNNNMEQQQQRIVEVRLPKLELPRFSGDTLEWPSFYDRFVAAVHAKDINPCLKFEYLASCLVGEAAHAVMNIPITEANYEAAWDLLKKRYHNNRKIATMHLDRLLSVPAIGHDIGQDLRKLVDTTNECMRALRALELPTDGWDFMICNILEQKLDSQTKRQ